MYIAIYQIDLDRDTHNLAFADFERTKRIQDTLLCSPGINSSLYNKVFEGPVRADSLEDIYYIFNQQHPEGYTGRSLSTSDVVQVVEDNPFGSNFYFCDSFGFRRVEFDSSKAHDPSLPDLTTEGPIHLEARLGISLEVTKEELDKLKAGDLAAMELLVNLIHSGRCEMGGDTYFPEPWNQGILEEDLNFDLPNTPLIPKERSKPSLDETIQNSAAKANESKKIPIFKMRDEEKEH